MTLPILNGFAKSFLLAHFADSFKVIKVPTTLKTRRYTTLQNTYFRQLHQSKHSNGKLSAHELRKM